MQWPVVLCRRRCSVRFPAADGGRKGWTCCPEPVSAAGGALRGNVETSRPMVPTSPDAEARKYLHLTWAPIAGTNNRYRRLGVRTSILAQKTSSAARRISTSKRCPSPRAGFVRERRVLVLGLTSFLKCPYQFKLRNPLRSRRAPKALGMASRCHDALAEVHDSCVRGVSMMRSRCAGCRGPTPRALRRTPRFANNSKPRMKRVLTRLSDRQRRGLDKIRVLEKQIE